MCGIAGYFGFAEISNMRLDQCMEAMRRRGPDDEGRITREISCGRNLYLIHSRLSVIDLDERSRQPFEHAGDLLCYNGEIYNYLELKSSLRMAGYSFSTSSDTEVLAQYLSQNGMKNISSCEGMWAFAWFDHNSENLFLCRDRFGEKPLYYYEDESGVYFGSEPKFIFALLGKNLAINPEHLRRFLVHGYKSLYKNGETFFSDLREVVPGCYRRYGPDGNDEQRYWSPNLNAQDRTLTYDDFVELTKSALVRSVELRLRADVPIAFCLSGGVDLNALISIAKRKLGYDVHGFTIMNTDERYEEREMVETAIDSLGLRHTEVPVSTDNFMSNLRELIKYHDAPIYTITYYAQWQLMEAVKRAGYKVSVSGTAADELFSGYYDHHNAYIAAMRYYGKTHYEKALENWGRVVKPIVRNPYLQDPEYFVKHPESRDHIILGADVFSSMLKEPFNEDFGEVSYAKELLRNRMANELFHESVPVILHEDDLNAMYHSIENRSPFLDTALFEVAQSIPTEHLIQNGIAKSVLREAVRGLAPDAIIDNPRKVGFNAPLFDYLDVKILR
ncbi:MAG: asparagine synthase (glutamine-hydrolyzing) [Thalassospira sp.]|uniref:asparagine synthase (glutamine-hydrolyzing) n=1 Tax=Thalassospira sp. TaxID=1912094 RepID=UPI003A8A4E40